MKRIAFLLAALLFAAPALAQEKITVGVLRFVSSGGLFLAVERGYFKAEGLEIDLKFFEAAQPIAVAVVSGDADFGVTALTAGFYNLAGKGALKIIGAQGREAKGFEGNAVLVSRQAAEKGFDDLAKFAGKSLGISQIGSSFHYQIGQIAAAKGVDIKSIDIKPLQSLPNMVAALKSGQVDAIIIAPHLAKPLIAAGDAKLLAWYSDIDEYQFGALFTGSRTIQSRRAVVEKFTRAYQKGAADYHAAFNQRDGAGKRVFDEKAVPAGTQVGKYVYPSDAPEAAIEKVKASAVFADPQAKLDAADIAKQVAWLKSQALVEPGVEAAAILDLSFIR